MTGEERKKLPGYLQDAPASGHVYGTLSYNRRSKCWTIKGEPCVTEMAKRLFPGSEKKRGEARFTANRRIIGEVNWLMMRYPLKLLKEIRRCGKRRCSRRENMRSDVRRRRNCRCARLRRRICLKEPCANSRKKA